MRDDQIRPEASDRHHRCSTESRRRVMIVGITCTQKSGFMKEDKSINVILSKLLICRFKPSTSSSSSGTVCQEKSATWSTSTASTFGKAACHTRIIATTASSRSPYRLHFLFCILNSKSLHRIGRKSFVIRAIFRSSTAHEHRQARSSNSTKYQKLLSVVINKFPPLRLLLLSPTSVARMTLIDVY